MQQTPLDSRRLLRSLASTLCPACAAKKRKNETFCGACYHALPTLHRKSLSSRLGQGYAEAVAAAMRCLNANVFNVPADAADTARRSTVNRRN